MQDIPINELLNRASENAHKAIEMLKESVLITLVEARESSVGFRPATIRDELDLKGLHVRRPSGTWGAIQIVSVVLYLLEQDECVEWFKVAGITYWKITDKGLDMLN